MVTAETTVNQKHINTVNVEPRISEKIARNQTPRGFTGLIVTAMNLLVKLDPR
jgi:hypothetical protein